MLKFSPNNQARYAFINVMLKNRNFRPITEETKTISREKANKNLPEYFSTCSNMTNLQGAGPLTIFNNFGHSVQNFGKIKGFSRRKKRVSKKWLHW